MEIKLSTEQKPTSDKSLSYGEKKWMLIALCGIVGTIFFLVGLQEWGLVLLVSVFVGDIGPALLVIVIKDHQLYGWNTQQD
jgi:hypothetical protein